LPPASRAGSSPAEPGVPGDRPHRRGHWARSAPGASHRQWGHDLPHRHAGLFLGRLPGAAGIGSCGRRADHLTLIPDAPPSVATPSVSELHGLTPAEYARIVDLIGRGPNPVELAMFGAMWSEHCAYKHSRPLLSTLPTQGDRVLVGPGENAGVLDIGDGLAAVFKVESHNHPSAVE